MIIKGDVVLKCPKTGKEVRLYEDCMKADDPKNTCEHYKHFGLEGNNVWIACAYDKWEQAHKQEAKTNEDI